MNEIALPPRIGGGSLIPNDLKSAMDLANLMAVARIGIPAHLQRSPGDCLMVIEQAMRWGMSPFAVAQCTSIVQGKLMFEGKLVSAALHSSGIMSSRLEYDFTGSGDSRAITVRGTLRGEDKPRDITITLKEAKTSNGMWTKQPDQQLVYFATRAWARRHASEVMLGVYSPEEFDVPAPQPAAAFRGTTIEAHVERPPPPTMGEQINDALPEHSAAPPKRKTWSELLDVIELEFAGAQTRAEVDAVHASERVQKALGAVRNGAKDRLDEIIMAAVERTAGVENAPENGQEDDGWPGPDPNKMPATRVPA